MGTGLINYTCINNIDIANDNSDQLKDNISISENTKPITYRTAINPNFSAHNIYMCKDFHRLCDCKSDVQTEEHIINLCQISPRVRDNYTDINFILPDVFLCRGYTRLCRTLTEIYKSYV